MNQQPLDFGQSVKNAMSGGINPGGNKPFSQQNASSSSTSIGPGIIAKIQSLFAPQGNFQPGDNAVAAPGANPLGIQPKNFAEGGAIGPNGEPAEGAMPNDPKMTELVNALAAAQHQTSLYQTGQHPDYMGQGVDPNKLQMFNNATMQAYKNLHDYSQQFQAKAVDGQNQPVPQNQAPHKSRKITIQETPIIQQSAQPAQAQ